MHGMEEMLSLEIKKEIADRYFGFRKMIEDDSRLYNEQILAAYRQLENEVGFDLVRLYILLHREALIFDFFRLTGFRDQVFLEPYLLYSDTLRRRLFKGQQIHGFTRRLRFNHLFFDVYLRLQKGLDDYGAIMNQLIKEGKAIVEEIEVFQRKNDLGSMMGFLRRLDSSDGGAMSGELSPLRDSYFEDKMRIPAPSGAETLLPAFAPLPPLKTCKGKLIDLLDKAFTEQHQPEVRDYCR
ncbi:MAG: hypothetical protein PHI97_05660 [Desulfobulbus sp.]|nr:hypothetical protein [Desulfobulbus sp.]